MAKKNKFSSFKCKYYSWKVCNCSAEIDSANYCRDCYDCIREHIEAAVEEEEYDDECLHYEECSQGYSLDKATHYEELKKNMEDLRKKIHWTNDGLAERCDLFCLFMKIWPRR